MSPVAALIGGSVIFLAGFYVIFEHVGVLVPIILMVIGVLVMWKSGKKFKEIDRVGYSIRCTKD